MGRTGTVEPEKKMGPACKCRMRCFKQIGDEACNKIFTNFWKLGDYSLQNTYLGNIFFFVTVGELNNNFYQRVVCGFRVQKCLQKSNLVGGVLLDVFTLLSTAWIPKYVKKRF